ncbi:hypothetical protein OIU76_011893 [Salix suchowensis]|nr:hypothetical protein OIU76_011893 [Salix suchowensis]
MEGISSKIKRARNVMLVHGIFAIVLSCIDSFIIL